MITPCGIGIIVIGIIVIRRTVAAVYVKLRGLRLGHNAFGRRQRARICIIEKLGFGPFLCKKTSHLDLLRILLTGTHFVHKQTKRLFGRSGLCLRGFALRPIGGLPCGNRAAHHREHRKEQNHKEHHRNGDGGILAHQRKQRECGNGKKPAAASADARLEADAQIRRKRCGLKIAEFRMRSDDLQIHEEEDCKNDRKGNRPGFGTLFQNVKALHHKENDSEGNQRVAAKAENAEEDALQRGPKQSYHRKQEEKQGQKYKDGDQKAPAHFFFLVCVLPFFAHWYISVKSKLVCLPT